MNDIRAGRITLAAVLLGVLLVGCGGTSATGIPAASESVASVPGSDTSHPVAPTAVPTTEAQFPPAPGCPGPITAPPEPLIAATTNDGAPVPGLLGSYTIQTCTSTASADMAGGDPRTPIRASMGDDIVVTVGSPWRVAAWEGSDHAALGEGANVWLPTVLQDLPRSFALGVPSRAGDSILLLDLILVTDDGRAVATIPVSFLVRVEP